MSLLFPVHVSLFFIQTRGYERSKYTSPLTPSINSYISLLYLFLDLVSLIILGVTK